MGEQAILNSMKTLKHLCRSFLLVSVKYGLILNLITQICDSKYTLHKTKHLLVSVTLLFHTKCQIHDKAHLQHTGDRWHQSCQLNLPCANFSRLFEIPDILHNNVACMCEKGDVPEPSICQ